MNHANGGVRASGAIFWGFPIRNRGATGKRLVTKGRLPVPSDDELGAIQKLGSSQEGPGKISVIKYRFEEVRTLKTGTRQIRTAESSSPEVGTAKIRPGQIEPGQIEPSQASSR